MDINQRKIGARNFKKITGFGLNLVGERDNFKYTASVPGFIIAMFGCLICGSYFAQQVVRMSNNDLDTFNTISMENTNNNEVLINEFRLMPFMEINFKNNFNFLDYDIFDINDF